MFVARAEIGDQTEAAASFGDHLRIDPVGHSGDEHVAVLHRGDQFVAAHWLVLFVEHDIEQLGHARVVRGQQTAGDYDAGLAGHARRGLVSGDD